MPVSLKRIRDTGTPVLLHRCAVCDGNAAFGFGVTQRKAMERLAAGDVQGAKLALGEWYCGEHRPDRPGHEPE